MAFEDTALLYLAAVLGSSLVVYAASEVFNALVSVRAVNSITNTTSLAINAVVDLHTASMTSAQSASLGASVAAAAQPKPTP
jgi:hypothetical protein